MNTDEPVLSSSLNRDCPELYASLARVIEPAQVGRWLKQPNAAFVGSTPLQVVQRGEADRVWRMLYDLESGQPA